MGARCVQMRRFANAGFWCQPSTMRLAIVSSHPIQYYAPIFQALAQSGNLQPKVFYTWSQTAATGVPDRGFARVISWDIPLLDGYEYEFVPNIAREPGTHHFAGLHNPGLNEAIERWRPDAVLVFAWNSRSHLNALRYFKGKIPIFFRGDSTVLNRMSAVRGFARRMFLRWVYKHIDVAIAVGSNNRDYYRRFGVPDARIAFAPHAVDTKRFADDAGAHEERAQQWRQELGIARSARVVLFAGKLISIKNPRLLLNAFVASRTAGHLVFVGNGELESRLRAQAGKRGNVHFLPFQNQLAMPAVYRLGNVFVLPSLSETWGLALNEAMASGRPIVASNKVGGARDLIKQGSTGWMFESDNVAGLTAVLREVLSCNAEVLQAMGEAARRESSHWSTGAAAHGIERAVLEFGRSQKGSDMSFA
jgi:glycosyltransferase involved in cell wall biosynthesis